MDLQQAPTFLNNLLVHHGSMGLLVLLGLGIFGLPIPDETLLVLAGFFMAKGKLSVVATPLCAIAGGCMGITLSYLLGFYAGKQVLFKYGKWIGLHENILIKTHEWYERFGKWTLLIGYYIPGIRHLNGFVAGSVYLNYWEFALFAYIGATIWAGLFLTMGYFFYDTWHLYLSGIFS